MPAINVVNNKNEKIETVVLEEKVFGANVNQFVVHDAVKMYLASQRQGTASVKNVATVSGTNRKPWRQKGTGRARFGSNKSPIWRGGGIIFGPVPRDYSYSITKKKRKIALRSALTHKAQESAIIILDGMGLQSPKTREMVDLLKNLDILDKKVLMVADVFDRNLCLSVRNISNVKLVDVSEVNVFDLLKSDRVLISKDKLNELTERLG